MNKRKHFRFILIILFFNIFFPFENSSLDIINFNIHGFGKIIGGCNIKKKINIILDKISSYDIILLQENWKHNDLIKDKLTKHQLIFSNHKKNFFSQSSGLFIAVKENIEIIDFNQILYNDCNGIIANGNDCFASKSFIFSRIKYNNKIIDIYNTHLDSGNSDNDYKARSNQLDYLKKYVIKNSSNNSIIICGDFNIDYSTSKEIKEFQNDLNLEIVQWNDSYFLDNKIDYIFYKIKFSHEMVNKDISNILYTLSDHPPTSLSMIIK